MFISIIIIGTIGYMFLLNITVVDALYMTVITISTVGYSEVAPMTTQARFFNMFIIFWGVGTAGYLFTTLAVAFVEGEITSYWRSRKVEKKIDRMKEHYILCGAGETGEVIVEEFERKNVELIIIERDEIICQKYWRKNKLCIMGDATEENVLKEANITNAKGFITTLSNDIDNVFAVLSARQLNPKLYIISRAIDRNAPKKLIKAGANKTISSNEIGGRRMATLMLRPSIMSFLDVITHVGEVEFDLEEVIIAKDSSIVNKNLQQLKLPEKIGIIILAIKRKNESEIEFNPNSKSSLNAGDTLLVLGTQDQVNRLRKMARDDGDRLIDLGLN